MRMRRTFALLSLVSLCFAQTWNQQTSGWKRDKILQTKSCSNLTQVLDNWKFAIMNQVKDLLVNDHTTVLPEYARIQPLSEALVDLHKQFTSLKEELGRLSSKFDRVEGFVDDLHAGKLPPSPPRAQLWTPPRRPVQRVASLSPVRTPVGAEAPLRRKVREPLRTEMKTPVRRNGTRPGITRTRGRKLSKD